ncbi:MAG: MBL fold metallo-hydrolase [Natronomonas sp.]
MRVTFLGTGAAMPTGDRFQTGLLFEGGDDGPLLVDCGSGVVHAVARTSIEPTDIETVLLTHHHLDHVSDVLPLLKARWLAGRTDLEIVGPPGTADLLEGLLSVHDYMAGRFDLDVREIGPGSHEVAGFGVEARETIHSMYCLAYRLEADDVAVTFSADTEASDDICALAEGSAVLIHDCSFPDGIEVDNHPTPRELGAALAGHEIGRVYLTHLYPHTDGHHEEMIDSVAANFDGEVRIPRDGLSIDVTTA